MGFLRSWQYWLFSVIFAAISCWYMYSYLEEINRRIPVVVAAQAIPAGVRLTGREVRLAFVPPAAAHPSALKTLKDVEGLITSVPLIAGEQVLSEKVNGKAEGLLGFLQEDEMAMYLHLGGRSYPASFIRRGQRISILCVTAPAGGRGTESRFVIGGLRVLEVFTDQVRGSAPVDHLLGVALAVTPYQAEQLAFAVERGKIHILLGFKGDTTVPDTPWNDALIEQGDAEFTDEGGKQ